MGFSIEHNKVWKFGCLLCFLSIFAGIIKYDEVLGVESRISELFGKGEWMRETVEKFGVMKYSGDGRRKDIGNEPLDIEELREAVDRARESGGHIEHVIDKGGGYEGKVNATYLVLCRNEDLYELLETIQDVEDRFNNRYGYDWVFLNDVPFTDEFIITVSSYIDQGKLSFGLIPKGHWGYPEHIDQEYAEKQMRMLEEKDVLYGGSISYRHMCRYYSGFFYKHPLVAQYQYYWRLEPGIKLYCDISYDVFEFMHSSKKKYAFVISLFEYEDTIPTLWDTFNSFLESYNATNKPQGEMLDFIRNEDEEQSYNLCHFWSNFEIADLSIFANEHYEAYFNYLDQAGGFYYERWGDAPVHTLAISWMLSKSDIYWFGDIGYYHAPYLSCPPPFDLRMNNKCSCNPHEDFSFSHLSCTPHLLNILNSNINH